MNPVQNVIVNGHMIAQHLSESLAPKQAEYQENLQLKMIEIARSVIMTLIADSKLSVEEFNAKHITPNINLRATLPARTVEVFDALVQAVNGNFNVNPQLGAAFIRFEAYINNPNARDLLIGKFAFPILEGLAQMKDGIKDLETKIFYYRALENTRVDIARNIIPILVNSEKGQLEAFNNDYITPFVDARATLPARAAKVFDALVGTVNLNFSANKALFGFFQEFKSYTKDEKALDALIAKFTLPAVPNLIQQLDAYNTNIVNNIDQFPLAIIP